MTAVSADKSQSGAMDRPAERDDDDVNEEDIELVDVGGETSQSHMKEEEIIEGWERQIIRSFYNLNAIGMNINELGEDILIPVQQISEFMDQSNKFFRLMPGKK